MYIFCTRLYTTMKYGHQNRFDDRCIGSVIIDSDSAALCLSPSLSRFVFWQQSQKKRRKETSKRQIYSLMGRRAKNIPYFHGIIPSVIAIRAFIFCNNCAILRNKLLLKQSLFCSDTSFAILYSSNNCMRSMECFSAKCMQ